MPRRHLFGLLLAFGLLAAIYSLNTPLFEAPDEPWHYAYVRWLAEGHGLPRLDDDASGAHQEAAQPPLYYAVAALVSSPFADDDLPELFWHNPQFGYQAGGTINDNKNMLIHTDREQLPWRGAVLAIRAARLVSLAFGLLALGATCGLACEALPGRPTLVAITVGVVAFTPQFLFISGVVSNDSATAAACTCALWALARIIRRGATTRRAAAAGLALGLALLSKTSALLLLPMAPLAICIFTSPRKCRWREVILMLGLAAGVGGWWYLRNWILFDDPLGLGVHVNTLWGRAELASFRDLLPELPRVFRSFWGAFGWGHVELSGVLYAAVGILVALSVLGWARWLRRIGVQFWMSRRSVTTASPGQPPSRRHISASTGIYLLAAWWCLAVLAALLRWMQQVEAPHGRLLFPALGAWGLLLTVGWSHLSPDLHSSLDNSHSLRVTRYVLLVPVAALLVLSLIVPFAVIRPAFALPRLLSPQAATQRVTSQALVYGDQARLLGYRVEPESAAAGEHVEVTLCWEALRPMDQDYMLFIHLLGRDNSRIGERTTYPGQGRFPTTLWPLGSAFCDSYRLAIASWAPTPELYALEVGLYDAETGQRLPAQNTTGATVEPPTLGLVRIVPALPLPRPENRLSYDLGGQVALVGYETGSTVLGSGATLTLTLYWEPLQVPDGDYKVFVHLLDEAGVLVAQDDAPPRGGHYPTWAWRPGDLVPDAHQVLLPDERPPGPYHWSVGMYHPDTYERLPVVGPEGALPDQAIPLGKIRW